MIQLSVLSYSGLRGPGGEELFLAFLLGGGDIAVLIEIFASRPRPGAEVGIAHVYGTKCLYLLHICDNIFPAYR